MTAARVATNVRTLPTCRTCSRGIRLANSLRSGLCCCDRGTCNTGEEIGCLICAREIEGIDLVIGLCSRCSVVVA